MCSTSTTLKTVRCNRRTVRCILRPVRRQMLPLQKLSPRNESSLHRANTARVVKVMRMILIACIECTINELNFFLQFLVTKKVNAMATKRTEIAASLKRTNWMLPKLIDELNTVVWLSPFILYVTWLTINSCIISSKLVAFPRIFSELYIFARKTFVTNIHVRIKRMETKLVDIFIEMLLQIPCGRSPPGNRVRVVHCLFLISRL